MTRTHAAVVLAACLTASTASAQDARPTATPAPAATARWDAAALFTWFGEQHSVEPVPWDRWFGAVSGGGIIGYHWTPHLKTEFDVSTSTEGEIYSVETIPVPGTPTFLFVERDHEIRLTTASLGLNGQFFENAWFHPFVGAGMELVREREHIETLPLPAPPRVPAIAPEPQSDTRVRYGARPYVATGFKAYVSERAFIRTDLRTSWSSGGLAAVAWRAGVGVDF